MCTVVVKYSERISNFPSDEFSFNDLLVQNSFSKHCWKLRNLLVRGFVFVGRKNCDIVVIYCLCFTLSSIRPVYGAQHPPRVEKPAERMEHGTPKRHVQQRDSFQDFQVKTKTVGK